MKRKRKKKLETKYFDAFTMVAFGIVGKFRKITKHILFFAKSSNYTKNIASLDILKKKTIFEVK